METLNDFGIRWLPPGRADSKNDPSTGAQVGASDVHGEAEVGWWLFEEPGSSYTVVASRKRWHNYGANHHAIFMGKLTVSMATFNSYLKSPEGMYLDNNHSLT